MKLCAYGMVFIENDHISGLGSHVRFSPLTYLEFERSMSEIRTGKCVEYSLDQAS